MSDGQTIAFFGSSLVSAYWNGAATYYRGVIRALDVLGYRVTFFEPDALERQANRDMDDPPWAKVVVYDATDEGLDAALDRARDSDVIVKASGVGVFDTQLEREVIERRSRGQIVIFWDVDAPATLGRIGSNPRDPFRQLIPEYDLILTYGGGPPVVNLYRSFGARECAPIYNAVDPTTHHPVNPDARFECDLAFLGNRLPDREARVEEFFFRAAAALPHRSFLLGGSGWADKPMPSNVRYLGHVSTNEHNALNCTPLAVLNVSRADMAATGYSPATRVFEAAGAGACLITDSWVGIGDFLEPGLEALIASSGADVADELERLDRTRAAAIGDAARSRVLREHTYERRAKQVADLLEMRFSKAAAAPELEEVAR